MQLRPYQQTLHNEVHTAWALGFKCVLIVLPTGGGKCLAKGTPVLMHDGTVRPVEAVQIGDILMGPDSQPRTVLSTCTGREAMYRISPTKGDPYVVNESHILSLRQTPTDAAPVYPSHATGGRLVNVSVKDYLAKSNWFKHIHKGWRCGVDFPARTYSKALTPYFMGLWLGDGLSRAPAITTADPEIVEYLRNYANDNGLQIRVDAESNGAAATYFLTSGRQVGINPVRTALIDVNVLLNKHIPHAYLTGSREQRLEVLAGLIDSDGHNNDNKGFDYISVKKILAENVTFLARSLGFAAYLTPCKKKRAHRTFRHVLSSFHKRRPCRCSVPSCAQTYATTHAEKIGTGHGHNSRTCGGWRLLWV